MHYRRQLAGERPTCAKTQHQSKLPKSFHRAAVHKNCAAAGRGEVFSESPQERRCANRSRQWEIGRDIEAVILLRRQHVNLLSRRKRYLAWRIELIAEWRGEGCTDEWINTWCTRGWHTDEGQITTIVDLFLKKVLRKDFEGTAAQKERRRYNEAQG